MKESSVVTSDIVTGVTAVTAFVNLASLEVTSLMVSAVVDLVGSWVSVAGMSASDVVWNFVTIVV